MARRRGRPERDARPRGGAGALGERGARRGHDSAADRALFEKELEKLASARREELEALKRADAARRAGADREAPEHGGGAARRARFSTRVRRGEVEPAARLDLHGCSEQDATARLRRFLATAIDEDVLVIHGRGLGILRAAVVAELDRHPRVAEHLEAPRDLGGAGARLVRLRRR